MDLSPETSVNSSEHADFALYALLAQKGNCHKEIQFNRILYALHPKHIGLEIKSHSKYTLHVWNKIDNLKFPVFLTMHSTKLEYELLALVYIVLPHLEIKHYHHFL